MKSLLRKYLPKDLKQQLHSLLLAIDLKLYPYFTKSAFLSSLYYLLFSSKFRREHKAVLNGRLSYHLEQKGEDKGLSNSKNSSNVLLRRNTHRLEKGLIMRPRRAVFAQAYIQETVECYARCVAGKNIDAQEMAWASDVLNEYFKVVADSDVTIKARAVFESAVEYNESSSPNGHSIPYPRSSLPELDVNFQQFKTLCIKRRSVRWYEPKKVPDELLNQAIEVASLAPSACNRQPFEFYVLNDLEKAPEIAALAGGTTGFADNVPCIIVVVGDLSAYPMERDRHIIYIDASLASMQLMLSLETVGLSSCALNWPDLDLPEQKMAKRLNLPAHKRPVMLMSVGYAENDGLIPSSPKKSIHILRKEIQL